MIFLTDFFGGMWLNIIQGPSLVWARTGGVLLYSLNAVLVYSILSSYFPGRRAFMAVLVCSLLATIRPGINIIDYYTFPAFLLNMMVWLIHKRLQAPTRTTSAHLYEFLIGFLAVPIVLGRMSLVLLLIWPVVMLLYHLLTRVHADRLARAVVLSLSGCACSCMVFGLLYWRLGLFDGGFLNLLPGTTSTIAADVATHSARRLVSVYWRHALIMAELTGWLIFGLYILSTIGRRFSQTTADILIVILPLAYAAYLFMQGGDADRIAYGAIMAAAGCTAVILLAALLMGDDHHGGLAYLVISGLTVMIITPLGAGSGFTKISHGMWLSLPLAVLCLEKMHGLMRNDRLSAMFSHTGAMLVLVVVSSLAFQFTNIYRDDGNRLHLTRSFSHPSLACIHSTPGRVQVVDQLIAAIERNAEKDDEILLAGSLPLFYYLTGTRAALHNPWVIADSPGNVKKRQQRLIEEDRLPKLFIHAKVDTRGERNWPDTSVDCYEGDREKLDYLKDEYIRRLRYELLWENRAFAVYGMPQPR